MHDQYCRVAEHRRLWGITQAVDCGQGEQVQYQRIHASSVRRSDR